MTLIELHGNKAKVSSDAYLSPRATLREKTPEAVLLAGVPAKPVGKLDDSDLAVMRYVAQAYTQVVTLYKEKS